MTQLTRADLKGMTAQQIVAAREAGQLHTLLTGQAPPDIPATGQLDGKHLQHMTPAQIVEARDAGRLAELLGA